MATETPRREEGPSAAAGAAAADAASSAAADDPGARPPALSGTCRRGSSVRLTTTHSLCKLQPFGTLHWHLTGTSLAASEVAVLAGITSLSSYLAIFPTNTVVVGRRPRHCACAAPPPDTGVSC